MTIPRSCFPIMILATIILTNSPYVYSIGNGISGATVKPGSTFAGSCGECHGGSQTAVVTIHGPATLAINQAAQCTVTVSGSPNMGVDIAVSAGTLEPVSSNLKLLNSELTHPDSSKAGPYIFKYTAPGTQQTVTMYASGLSGGTGGSTGVWGIASNHSISVPLPIQISSFTGALVNTHTVRLEWSTISEIDNYGFYIQRRSVTEQDFVELSNAFIPGHGTTNAAQHYSYTDDQVSAGEWYYRLRQVDLDGTSHFSDPVQVVVVTGVSETRPAHFGLSQNYPNPFNPSTTIPFSLAISGHVTLQIYNLRGQLVATLVNGERAAGDYHVEWTSRDAASGMYICRLSSGDRVEARKLLLMK